MAVQLTYHGSPFYENILQEGFKQGKPTGGFSWKLADAFQKGATTLTTADQSLASMYGRTIPVASSTQNLRLPSGAITKGGIGFGTEVIQTPRQATKGMDLASRLGTRYTGPTATRLLGGETVSGLGGATATGGFLRNLIGSNIATGLPLGYAALADALQGRLEDQGLTGEGGIADVSGLWGAEAAGADVEYDINAPNKNQLMAEDFNLDFDEIGNTIVPDKGIMHAGILPPQLLAWMHPKNLAKIWAKQAQTNLALETGGKFVEKIKQEKIKKKQEAEARAALQARVTAQANREAARRVARGEGRDYGHTETRASSGWRSSPFYQGGRVGFSKGGIVDLWQELSNL